MEPENPRPLKDALEAIKEADVIVLGPGSLYTSILPNLLIPGVFEAIKQSRAAKVYVCNVMTQPGETDGYSVYEHIEAIEKHTLKGIIDCCIVNDAQIPEELRKKYMEDGSEAVRIDMENLNGRDIKIISGDFAFIDKNLVRHNAQKLAGAIIELVAETVLAVDKKRTIDYYYAKNRLSAKNRQ